MTMRLLLLVSFLLSTLFGLLLLPLAAQAQGGRLGGTVTDTETGEPLPGTNVVLLELGSGSAVTGDGSYEITGVPAGAYTLRASFVGYVARDTAITVAAGASQTVDLALAPDLSELSEVVVTALGVERETRNLGYATQEVEAAALERSNESNVVNALAGKVAGVEVSSASGQPGGASRITIRGNSSLLGNNQPLFVVDGVPISNVEDENAYDGLGTASTPLFSGGTSNRALDLDPSVIEEVNVLKGASATALYGSRAANGAVLITTKSGNSQGGQPRVTVSSRLRWDEAIIDGYQDEYLQGQNGFYQNGLPEGRGGFVQEGAQSIAGSAVTNPQTTLSWGPHKDEVDPSVLEALGVDAIATLDPRADFYQAGVVTENTVSLSGGGASLNYFLSVGDLRQEGIVPGTQLDRSTLLAKFSADLTDKLHAETSVNLVRTANDWLAEGNGTQSYLYALNFAPISFDITDFQFADGSQRMNTTSFNNPLWLADNNSFQSDVHRLIGHTEVRYQVLPWLTARERLGLDTYQDARKEETNIGTVGIPNGRTYDQQIGRTEINSDLTLQADRQLSEKIGLSALVGNNVNSRTYQTDLIRGQDLNIPGFYQVSSANVVLGDEESERQLLLSAYGQATLDYENYLFLNLTARNDWSSTLPADNRSYFYPSASLGFVFTDALRLFENTPLSFGKLRASLAQVGNDAPVYALATNFTRVGPGDGQRGVINYPFNGVNGFRVTNVLGNPDLKPEISTEYEVGGNVQFFGRRLRLDAAYYNRTTRDQIFQVPVSGTTGFVARLINAGEIQNRGVELSLGLVPLQTGRFSWDVASNFAKNTTEVVKLTEGVESIFLGGFTSPEIVALPGEDGYGVIRGTRYARNEEGQLLIGNDGLPLQANTIGAIGNVQPDWTANLRNTLSYRGLRLSALLDVRRGGDILNFDQFYTTFYGTAEVTEDRGSTFVFEGVNATTGAPNTTEMMRDEAFYRFLYSSVYENFVEDGGFVKLREVSLGYTLPTAWVQRAGLSSASLTATGRNLWIHSDFSYGDPEGSLLGAGNAQGFYHAVTPGTRSYALSVHLGF